MRAATLRFAPDASRRTTRPGSSAAIATARPEAQRLIAEIDGLVEVRTDLNRPGIGPIGRRRRSASRAAADARDRQLDVTELDGERAIDRNVVVLHELGHVIDFLLRRRRRWCRQLDAGIPRVGTCTAPAEPTGACTAVAGALRRHVRQVGAAAAAFSLAGSGYGIPTPAVDRGLGPAARPPGRELDDQGAQLGLGFDVCGPASPGNMSEDFTREADDGDAYRRAGRGARCARAGTARGDVRPYPGYRTLWVWLLLGWVASGADRTITGPVVTYMIDAKVPIIGRQRTTRSRSAASSAACCSPATCSPSSRAATSATASATAR